MLGLLFGIYMTLQGDLRRFEIETHKYAINSVEYLIKKKSDGKTIAKRLGI